jgi:hypothetical protein
LNTELLFRGGNVLFDGKDAFLADLVVELVLHHQDVHEVLDGVSVLEGLADLLQGRLERVRGGADEDAADGRAAQRDVFRRDDQDEEVASRHEEAAEHAEGDNEESDDGEHGLSWEMASGLSRPRRSGRVYHSPDSCHAKSAQVLEMPGPAEVSASPASW